jgi:uncharacterized protein YfaS (alpha-2-macroglobulin family)
MRIFILVIILSLFLSCQKKKKEIEPGTLAEQFREKISLDDEIIQAPPSIVPITSCIDIEFRKPLVPSHLRGTILDKNPFTFEPQIEGYSKWISAQLLRFFPDDNLPAGKSIQGTLHGKILLGEQREVDDFHFTFKVADQEILSLEGDFNPVQDKRNTVVYQGVITFAQPVDLEIVRKDLRLQGPDGKVKVNLTQKEDRRKIEIVTEPIIRSDKGKSFIFSLPSKYTAGDKKWELSVFLPEVNVFRVLAHMDMSDPSSDKATYGFRFSDPIMKNIDLSGYISLKPEIEFTARIKDKYVLLEANFIAGQSYSIKIARGFPSAFNMKLTDDYRGDFTLNNIKPEIRWLSEGVFLPGSNEYKLQFRSVNIARVNISVTEIFPQNIGFFIQSNIIQEKKSSGYYYDYEYDYYSNFQDLSRVGEEIFKKELTITSDKNKWVRSELDLSSVFKDKKNSAFVISLQFGKDDLTGRCINSRDELGAGDLYYEPDDYYSNPCKSGYYYSRGTLNKLLISSDVGLTVKKADDGIHVFTTDVLTARPISELKLEMYSYQNKLLETKNTDNNGHALFSQTGYYIYGKNQSGIALIKLNQSSWQLNNFDVGGASGGIKGTDVFIYTDRGVHRPGDTIHLSAIVRMDRNSPPAKQPVLLKVKNSKGQVVLDKKTECGFNGHIYFPITTDLADPTGDWTAIIDVGGKIFSRTLKVETVKPNRLKITFDLPAEVHPPRLVLKGTLTTKYLFGAPAANLNAKIKIELESKHFMADKFPEYTFTSPLMKFERRTAKEFDINLDQNGVFDMVYPLSGIENAPGLIQARIHTNVYEKGGSYTEDTRGVTIYPYEAFTGIKNVFHWNSAKIGENYSIPLIVVDAKGNPVEGHHLKVAVYVNRHHWWYHYDRRDKKDFKRMESTYLIGEYSYQSGIRPVIHQLTVEDYGKHYIEVTDKNSGHTAGFFFYGYQWGRPESAEEGERNYLQISSDKNVYNIGDEAGLSFDSPDKGMALLSIEQGNRIIRQEWKYVERNKTSFHFSITEDMIPNCYSSISLIQPHNQNTNDLPMRTYGIKTIYVEDRSTRLPLSLSAPEELKPKESFKIKVTSSAPTAATYTIAIVDEGLLDITAFQTPSPWDHFYQKIRLAIQTLDNFDDIIGILYPDIDKYFSIGGGVGAAEMEMERKKRLAKSRVQRFIPVVLFQQPVTIEPGRSIETTFTMPNYIGSVRIMVIGAGGTGFASLEKTVPIRQSLMILPTVPRIARPGDVFSLPISVFSMDKTIKQVRLSLKTSSNLMISGPASINVPFPEPGEQDVSFSLTVGNRVGADSITVLAESGSHRADYTVHLPITSPNPFFTEVTDTVVVKDKPVILIPEKFGLEGTNKAKLVFSRLPDIQLEKQLSYLIRYPYGCIEQTLSSVFPQLYLPNLVELKPYQKQEITDNINAGIKRLTAYQMSSGFSSWPLSDYYRPIYSNWCSNYAGHFLVEAKNLGYNVPSDLYNHWLKDAKKRAKELNKENHRYQAYRLFLLALANEPNIGAMNVLRENYLKNLDPLSKKFLAAAYYISGKKEVADEIERASSAEMTGYRELTGTYGSSLRDRALMTYLCLVMDDKKTAADLLRKVTKSFTSGGWYSTQETAMTLLAVSIYYKAVPFVGGNVYFKVKVEGQDEKNMELKGYQVPMELDNNVWGKNISIKTDRNDPVYVTLFEEGIPIEDRIKTEHKGIELNRNFYTNEGLPIAVDQRQQGESFWVVYRVKNAIYDQLSELALSSIFPSGWEIINPRISGETLPSWIKNLRPSSGDFMDIRDDRVNWFFNLPAYNDRVFVIKINPSFKGTYRLPPVSLEAMYSPEYFAHIEGGTVTVK